MRCTTTCGQYVGILYGMLSIYSLSIFSLPVHFELACDIKRTLQIFMEAILMLFFSEFFLLCLQFVQYFILFMLRFFRYASESLSFSVKVYIFTVKHQLHNVECDLIVAKMQWITYYPSCLYVQNVSITITLLCSSLLSLFM